MYVCMLVYANICIYIYIYTYIYTYIDLYIFKTMANICPKCYQHMYNICITYKKNVKHMSNTCQTYMNICRKHVGHM